MTSTTITLASAGLLTGVSAVHTGTHSSTRQTASGGLALDRSFDSNSNSLFGGNDNEADQLNLHSDFNSDFNSHSDFNSLDPVVGIPPTASELQNSNEHVNNHNVNGNPDDHYAWSDLARAEQKRQEKKEKNSKILKKMWSTKDPFFSFLEGRLQLGSQGRWTAGLVDRGVDRGMMGNSKSTNPLTGFSDAGLNDNQADSQSSFSQLSAGSGSGLAGGLAGELASSSLATQSLGMRLGGTGGHAFNSSDEWKSIEEFNEFGSPWAFCDQLNQKLTKEELAAGSDKCSTKDGCFVYAGKCIEKLRT
jgi:hypothetical protein